MKLQTYFLKKALVAFSDFLSTGRKKFQREGCSGRPSGTQKPMASPLPHKACISSTPTVQFLSTRHSQTDGVVRSAQFP